ncbi:MAG: sigma 54-interacting transcriptional regulator [Planctomycetota bacterium]
MTYHIELAVVEEGARSCLSFAGPTVRIGRALDNEVRLSDPLVSRHHCRLELGPEGTFLVDPGSANGTLLNGRRTERAPLAAGDVVTVGSTAIAVERIGEETRPARPGDTQRIAAADVAGALAESAGEGQGGLRTLTGEALRQREHLRVFARITRELVRETDSEALLRNIVDSAIDLVGGERGFLLLGPHPAPDGAAPDPARMQVRVARAFDQSDIPVPASRLSTGIVRRVAEKGRPLLSVDAGSDARFEGMASVEDLRLRSVLCLPIGIDGRVEGILYLDNRLQRGAFTADDLDLAELFAGQAAIAIHNARLVAELRERNQRLVHSGNQIRSLNEQLGRKIRDRDSELSVMRAELERERGRYDYGSIVGASDPMRKIFRELDRIIETDLPVFICGESGTGKELIARAIHFNGARKDKPFVAENCAALPDSLLESELFGHTRGAFTGADRAKKGLMEQAHGGTLFLDEIGDMSAEMQKKLLRVLQDGELRPLGSNQRIQVDVRLLVASHRDLDKMVKAGEFREDLFYRVNVLTLRLPPLRERRDDIPLLAEALLARAAREAGQPTAVLPHEVLAVLTAYDWPGNVRELENEMRRALLLGGDAIRLEHISPRVRESLGTAAVAGTRADSPLVVGDLRAAVSRFERHAIEDALAAASGNKSRAAKTLGISRFALQRKLDKFGGGSLIGGGGGAAEV